MEEKGLVDTPEVEIAGQKKWILLQQLGGTGKGVRTNSGNCTSSIMKNIELAPGIYSFILFNMNVPCKNVK